MREIEHIFLEAKEQQITALGITYLQNFLRTGKETGGFCVVSDTRIYLKGTFYIKKGRRYRKSKEAKIVELKDIIKVETVNRNCLGHREKMVEIICRDGVWAICAEECKETEIQKFRKYLQMARAYYQRQDSGS